MRRPIAPLFLARAVYRRRRLRDAARMLPLVGVFLLLLPGLWAGRGFAGSDAVYIFAVWALLIAGAALLAPALSDPEADRGEDRKPDVGAGPP